MKDYAPLWKSYFPTALEMIYFHYQDYEHAVNVSQILDDKIELDAYRVSKNPNYAAIVALSTRQAMGAVVLVESAPGRIVDGTGSKPLAFLKEISSNGNMQTVDVIFPAYSLFPQSDLTQSESRFTCIFNLRYSGYFSSLFSNIRKRGYILISIACMTWDHLFLMRPVIQTGLMSTCPSRSAAT
jgi:hypothetical protein